MLRPAATIVLSAMEQQKLTGWARAVTTPQRLARRWRRRSPTCWPATLPPSRSSIWRWLMHDALRPWRHQCWIFPRDPHFLEVAGPVLDLYACRWAGQPLWADEYVLSVDEKTSIQVRRRLQATRTAPSGQSRV